MRINFLIFLYLITFIGFSQTKDDDIDSLAIELAFQEQDSLKVKTSLKLIKSLYNNGSYDRALQYVIESEKLSNTLNYKDAQAEITYYKSLIYDKKGDYINAISGFSKSKDLYKALNDTINIAKVNNSIGLIEVKKGNYKKGLQHTLIAVKHLENTTHYNELNIAYTNLANTYNYFNETDKAIDYYTKALNLQKLLNNTTDRVATNFKLAELYSLKKEHRKAIEVYENMLANDSLNRSDRAHLYPKLGGEYLKFNDFENASKYLIRGYNLNVNNNKTEDFLIVLNHLSQLNINKNRLVIAEKQLQKSGELAKKLNSNKELLRHYMLMKTLDSIKKRFDKAYIWQQKYYELNTAILKEQNQLSNQIASSTINETNVSSFDSLINETETKPIVKPIENTYSDNENYNKLKLLFYAVLAALAIVSTFLIFMYVKRNNTIRYTQELEEKNIKIELQNEAFLEQTKHLESVNNVKDKLFSIVSHDLKDSLSSITGFIELLRDGSLSRDEFENLIPELSENASNASLLLFNLLNWSKSQMQSLEPKPTLFDVQEVFKEKVKIIENRLDSKGIFVNDQSLRDFAYADRSMIEIVVQNLLANALKFSKKGDTITVSNYISNGNCIISVADTGVGISKDNIEKLFKGNSFTTIGTNNEKGTGLGLSICKELVELNNGKIWVESTLGVGSSFYVQLPKSRPNTD
ncbi:tetratricopeptide repeat protein [Tamlana sp. 62-3]|uniref:histidine kinase n=1 Tax=Neotamlana sargassicola TaxID=2883125 RepID=A0A9X1I4Q5_9FLAO|nr:ATP-binding protein [Tamlana sargassicola]MCB4806639.1 tetratricopeptide repeat protein [Tamlana sargassicola]